MTVESATYINTLNGGLPTSTDAKAEGDDHIRLVKTVLQTTFPNINAAVTATPAGLNAASSVASSGTFPGVALTGVTSLLTSGGGVLVQSPYPGTGATPVTNSMFFQAMNSVTSQVAQAGIQGVFNRILDTDYGSSLLFYTATDNASLERMRIDNNGNVFVGTTAGGAKVNVLNAAASQTLNLTNSSSGSGSTTMAAFTNAVDADFSVQVSQVGAASKFTSIGTSVANPFSLQTAGTERMRIDASGNIGVGTSAPAVKVHVKGAGATPRFRAESTSGVIAEFLADTNNVGQIGTISNHPFNIYANSSPWITVDQVGHFYGSALHNNANLPTGTTNQYIASGTYTPTLTNLASFSSITAFTAQWMRVGNVVTVSGEFNATAAATSTCSMRISLPIASTLGTTGACSGVMPGHNGSTSPGGITGYIKGDTVNNAAQGTVLNDGFNGAGTWGFYFTYVVL